MAAQKAKMYLLGVVLPIFGFVKESHGSFINYGFFPNNQFVPQQNSFLFPYGNAQPAPGSYPQQPAQNGGLNYNNQMSQFSSTPANMYMYMPGIAQGYPMYPHFPQDPNQPQQGQFQQGPALQQYPTVAPQQVPGQHQTAPEPIQQQPSPPAKQPDSSASSQTPTTQSTRRPSPSTGRQSTSTSCFKKGYVFDLNLASYDERECAAVLSQLDEEKLTDFCKKFEVRTPPILSLDFLSNIEITYLKKLFETFDGAGKSDIVANICRPTSSESLLLKAVENRDLELFQLVLEYVDPREHVVSGENVLHVLAHLQPAKASSSAAGKTSTTPWVMAKNSTPEPSSNSSRRLLRRQKNSAASKAASAAKSAKAKATHPTAAADSFEEKAISALLNLAGGEGLVCDLAWQENFDGDVPFFVALRAGNKAVVGSLLKYTDLYRTDRRENNILHICAYEKQAAGLLPFILEQLPNMLAEALATSFNDVGYTPLIAAFAQENYDAAEILVDIVLEFSSISASGDNILQIAIDDHWTNFNSIINILNRYENILKQMLVQQDSDNPCVLVLACKNKRPEILRLLLPLVDEDTLTEDLGGGKTFLHYAVCDIDTLKIILPFAQEAWKPVMQQLLRRMDEDRETPLDVLLSNDWIANTQYRWILTKFLSLGTDAIIFAKLLDDERLEDLAFSVLCSCEGAIIHQFFGQSYDDDGAKVHHLAAEYGCAKILRKMIEMGAPLFDDDQRQHSWLPLYLYWIEEQVEQAGGNLPAKRKTELRSVLQAYISELYDRFGKRMEVVEDFLKSESDDGRTVSEIINDIPGGAGVLKLMLSNLSTKLGGGEAYKTTKVNDARESDLKAEKVKASHVNKDKENMDGKKDKHKKDRKKNRYKNEAD